MSTERQLIQQARDALDLIIQWDDEGFVLTDAQVDKAKKARSAIDAHLSGPQAEAQPVAWVPVHPREGPLWANTTADPDRERLPSYPLMALYNKASEPTQGKA